MLEFNPVTATASSHMVDGLDVLSEVRVAADESLESGSLPTRVGNNELRLLEGSVGGSAPVGECFVCCTAVVPRMCVRVCDNNKGYYYTDIKTTRHVNLNKNRHFAHAQNGFCLIARTKI